MKKKFVSMILTVMMIASLTTACGGKSETSAPAAETKTEAPAPAAETKAETPAPAAETKTETEPESETVADDDSSASEDFTLLDVTTDMISAGVYAVSEDQTELVFSMFTEPSGTQMASLFVFSSDGSGDVICGPYTAESETDEDGITWSVLTVSDVYTDGEFEIGFGETEDGGVYILDTVGGIYEGQYLSEDETIVYMGTAVALMEDGGSADDSSADDSSEAGEFTLLDVTTDMISAGVYAVSEDQTELVFSMFTEPSGTQMASLFVFASDGSGDVICGPYTAESETDEDGITWSVLTVSDVYTDSEFEIGFGETEDGGVYILNAAGEVYEGQYLSADETIVYMGTAVALME